MGLMMIMMMIVITGTACNPRSRTIHRWTSWKCWQALGTHAPRAITRACVNTWLCSNSAEIGCSILHKTANNYLDGFWPVECWLWGKIIRKLGLGCWFAGHAHGLITVFCHNFKCMQFFWKPDLKSIRSRPESRCISQLKVAQFCHFGHFCRRFTKAVARNQNFKMALAGRCLLLLLPDTFSQKCNGFLDSPLQQNLAMLCCLKTGSWTQLRLVSRLKLLQI